MPRGTLDCLDSGSKRAKILQKCVGKPRRTAGSRSLVLALRAVMGSAASDDNPANRCLAAAAGLAGAQVDAVLKLKKATLAIGVNIIGNRRAAESNGVGEDLAQCNPQPVELGACQAVGAATRANAGMKEAFVGVDIAH